METRIIKTKLVGKDEVFNVLALGEVTGLPVLLLGDPGVGKTQALLDYAAAKYSYNKEEVRKNTFVIELDEGTRTSEIKGRVNMQSLLEDKEYKLDTPIADAEYLLINEVDKGTSGIRNTLVSVMREKALFYGDIIKKCRWQVMVGSCNVIPDDELENPFWDRFVLTQKVERVDLSEFKSIWKSTKVEKQINLPTVAEIKNNKVVDINAIQKFTTVVYDVISDRTASYLPHLISAIQLIWNLDQTETLMKACELIAPTKLPDLSAKLESKRENSVRSSIESLQGVIDGGNDAYTNIYIANVLNELKQMYDMKSYNKKSIELTGLLMSCIEINGSTDMHDVAVQKLHDLGMSSIAPEKLPVDTGELT